MLMYSRTSVRPHTQCHYAIIICFCFFRVTVQHWKNSDHYTANRSETVSLSSSRGSSFMSSIGLKPKIRSRYGSSPADRVTTVVNPEFFYSTPLWCIHYLLFMIRFLMFSGLFPKIETCMQCHDLQKCVKVDGMISIQRTTYMITISKSG